MKLLQKFDTTFLWDTVYAYITPTLNAMLSAVLLCARKGLSRGQVTPTLSTIVSQLNLFSRNILGAENETRKAYNAYIYRCYKL